MAIAWQYMPTTRLRPRRSPSGFCSDMRKSSPLPTVSAYRPCGMRVAGPQVGQQGQAGHRRVGLPVSALPEAGLAGGAVAREIVVALGGRAIVVAGDAGVPAAVASWWRASQSRARSTASSLAAAGAQALGLDGTIGVQPGLINARDLGEGPAGGTLFERRQARAAAGGDSRLRRHAIEGEQSDRGCVR